MDAGALLGDLEGPRRDGRLPALDRLLQLPRGLRELDPRRLAPALHACLADECPEVRCRSAALVPEALESLHRAAAAPAEAAPPQKAVVASEEAPRGAPLGRAAAAGAQASRHEELVVSLQKIRHRLADNLGDSHESVRAATRQCLVEHASTGRHLQGVLKLVVDFGITRQSHWRVRFHNILAVQHLVTPVTGIQLTEPDIVGLLEELAPSLDDSTELVAHAAKQTLEHVECVLDAAFAAGVRRSSAAARRLLEEHGVVPAAAPQLDPGVPCCGPPPAPSGGHPGPAGPPRTAAGGEDCVAAGFEPLEALQAVEAATRWQDRSRLLEDFHRALLRLPAAETFSHMGEVLLILSRLLTDTNFKITLTTLYILGDLVDRWPSSMMTVVGAVVPGLVEKLGDNKIVIRQTTMKILWKIFSAVARMGSPNQYAEKLLQSLIGSLPQRSSYVRVELTSVIVMALLVFEKAEVPYDCDFVVLAMCQAAQDTSERAAAGAAEALAVVQLAVGSEQLERRLAELLRHDKDLLDRLLARLDCGALASVTNEGLVEFPTPSQLQPAVLPPTSPTRAPAAAMVMGKLGRRMFCLEEQPGRACSPAACVAQTQSTSSLTSAMVRRQGRGELLRRGAPSSHERSVNVAAELLQLGHGLWTKSTSSRSPPPSAGLALGFQVSETSHAPRVNSPSSDSSSNADRERPARCGLLPAAAFEVADFAQEEGQQRRRLTPPLASCPRDRRRAPMQLRVNFKEELISGQSSVANSARKECAELESAVQSPTSFDGSPMSRAFPRCPQPQALALAGSGVFEAAAPNYIPNWGGAGLRPHSRATASRGSGSHSEAAARSAAVALDGAALGGASSAAPPRACNWRSLSEGKVAPPSHHRRLLPERPAPLEAFQPAPGSPSGGGAPPSGRAPRREAGEPAAPGHPASIVGMMGPEQVLALSPGDVKDKLKLLKGCPGSRARSQGSCRGPAAPPGSQGSHQGIRRAECRSSHADLIAWAASPGLAEGEVEAEDAEDGCAAGVMPATAPHCSPEGRGPQPRRPRLGEGGAHACAEDLPAFDHTPSERWLDDVLRRLSLPASDWSAHCEALTALRRVARHAPHLLATPPVLRQAATVAAGLTESPRASVARNALICLNDMLLTYRQQMDPELDRVALACLKKASDASGFLSEEADRTLAALCRSASESRGLSAVLSIAADAKFSKSVKLRVKCIWCFATILPRLGPRALRGASADIDKLVRLLGPSLGDVSSEVRGVARQAAAALQAAVDSPEEFERLLSKNLATRDHAAVRRAVVASSHIDAEAPGSRRHSE